MRVKTFFPSLGNLRIIGFLFVLLSVAIPFAVLAHQHPQGTGARAAGCTSAAVTKNLDGTYDFSLLRVNRGKIVDENDCVVYLRGFNTAGTEFGDAVSGLSSRTIARFSQTFKMNLWRLALNVVWWNENAYVPTANMHYQDWIKQLVKWMEANGAYVELNAQDYTTDPPCGGNINFCSTQHTGNTPRWTERQRMTATKQMWTSIAPLFASDPAVLYDILNEPTQENYPHFQQDFNTLITIIRARNPQALIIVFCIGLGDIREGSLPDYAQPNLVYDMHVYPPHPQWKNNAAGLKSIAAWLQQHNHGMMIGEWGGPRDYNPYNDVLISFAAQSASAMAYYEEHAMFNGEQLSPSGGLVQKGYASLPGGAPVQ